MTNLLKIEGIGEKNALKLQKAGVKKLEDLLTAATTPKAREGLAQQSGISEKLILEWVNLADLFRIKGVGEEYSDLLEEAGVDTVPELAQRNGENLFAKMTEVNTKKNLVNKLPSVDQVKDWIEQAKKLDRIVKY
jgi:predicted flap endonuclease-1-like 5' DNA nuclease